MRILKALQVGGRQLWRYKQLIVLLYVSTIGLALFVALPLQNYLNGYLAHSLVPLEMLKGFNYSLINDFMNNYGGGIVAIFNQSALVIILYMLLLVFMMGGIISLFQTCPSCYNKSIFWQNNAHFWWRMLRLSTYFCIIHVLVVGIFIYLFLQLTHNLSPLVLETDALISQVFSWLCPVYIIVASFFFMWHDYAKIQLVKLDTTWVYRPIFAAFTFIIKHLANSYSLYCINIALLGTIFVLNYYLSPLFSINSSGSLLAAFAFSQGIILLRLSVKLLNLSSATSLSNSYTK